MSKFSYYQGIARRNRIRKSRAKYRRYKSSDGSQAPEMPDLYFYEEPEDPDPAPEPLPEIAEASAPIFELHPMISPPENFKIGSQNFNIFEKIISFIRRILNWQK